MILVIFRRFLNFGPFFGPFLGTLVENAKSKRVAPGNSLNFPKILTLIFGSLKCVFPKCTFSEPQLSRRGLVWYLLNSCLIRWLILQQQTLPPCSCLPWDVTFQKLQLFKTGWRWNLKLKNIIEDKFTRPRLAKLWHCICHCNSWNKSPALITFSQRFWITETVQNPFVGLGLIVTIGSHILIDIPKTQRS